MDVKKIKIKKKTKQIIPHLSQPNNVSLKNG